MFSYSLYQCVLSFLSTLHAQILDKLLDRESQTHKPQTLSSFYSSKPAAGSQRSPSKHTSSSHSGVGGATGVVSKHATSSSSASTLVASSSSSSSALTIGGEGVAPQADLNPVPNNTAGESAAETREHGKNPITTSLGFHLCVLVILQAQTSTCFRFFRMFTITILKKKV